MATITLRPNVTVDPGSAWSLVGADYHTALADNLDASYAQHDVVGFDHLVVGFGAQSFGDGVTTNASTTFTSATAAFVATDVGKVVHCAGVPVGTTVASVTSATSVVLSAAATATATASFTVMRTVGVAFPALSQVRTVTPQWRATFLTSVYQDVWQVWLRTPDGSFGGAGSYGIDYLPAATYTGVIVSAYGTPLAQTYSGVAWTADIIDGLTVDLASGGGPQTPGRLFRMYELSVAVEYNEAPTVTVTGPSGATVTTSTPTVAWSYADAEGDPQEAYRIRVFDQGQYLAGGFDPATSVAVWESGDVLSASNSAVVGASLENDAYRAYVSVADVRSGIRYGPWAYIGFTVETEPPAVPVLTAAADSQGNRVAVTVTGRDNYLTGNQSSLETDTTGWAAATNATVARSTTQAAQGLASLLVTAVAGGDAVAATPSGISGFPVSAGTTITLYYEVRKASGATRGSDSALVFYDSGGGVVAGGFAGSDSPDALTGSFSAGYSRWDVPAGAVTARATLTLKGGGAGEAAYFDAVGVFPYVDVTQWTLGGFPSTSRFTVERSNDGGVTWVVVRRFNRVAHDGPATQRLASYDFEAPRGVALLYRARVAGSSALSSPVSAWTANVPVTLLGDGQGWLKSYLDPALNTTVCLVKDSVDSTSTEDQGVFEALGRADPLIHGGTVRLEVFDGLEFWFNNDAEWDAFEAVRRLQAPVLLQTCFGDDDLDEWWLRLGPTREVHRVTHDGMGTAQFRSATIGAREVLAPEVT